jgi:hypothetical protein
VSLFLRLTKKDRGISNCEISEENHTPSTVAQKYSPHMQTENINKPNSLALAPEFIAVTSGVLDWLSSPSIFYFSIRKLKLVG